MVLNLMSKLNLNVQGLFRFQPKVILRAEWNGYIIKSATTLKDLNAVFSIPCKDPLHYQAAGIKGRWASQDLTADHLMVIDSQTGRLVAAARVHSSSAVDEIPIELEFDIEHLVSWSDVFLEVSRLRVSPFFDEEKSVEAIKYGVIQYAAQVEADHVFVSFLDSRFTAREVALIYHYCRTIDGSSSGPVRGTDNFGAKQIRPRLGYDFPQLRRWHKVFDRELTQHEIDEASVLVKGPLLAYLKAGAKLVAQPCWNPGLGCFKFLTQMGTLPSSGNAQA